MNEIDHRMTVLQTCLVSVAIVAVVVALVRFKFGPRRDPNLVLLASREAFDIRTHLTPREKRKLNVVTAAFFFFIGTAPCVAIWAIDWAANKPPGRWVALIAPLIAAYPLSGYGYFRFCGRMFYNSSRAKEMGYSGRFRLTEEIDRASNPDDPRVIELRDSEPRLKRLQIAMTVAAVILLVIGLIAIETWRRHHLEP